MKKKDIQELHSKEAGELVALLKKAKEELFNFRMDHSMKKLKNTKSLFNKKKDIARILTVLSEKKIALKSK